MKVKVLTEGKTITVDMPKDQAEQTFNKIASMILGLSETKPEQVCDKQKEEQEHKLQKTEREEGVYSGFLYMKCESCGKEKAFCTKGISEYTCDCGHTTPLQDLKPLFVNCKCGRRFRYFTNMQEEQFDVECIECGSPVSVNWNPNKKRYQTMQ